MNKRQKKKLRKKRAYQFWKEVLKLYKPISVHYTLKEEIPLVVPKPVKFQPSFVARYVLSDEEVQRILSYNQNLQEGEFPIIDPETLSKILPTPKMPDNLPEGYAWF